MTDQQFKELIQAIGSVSWHLKRLADLEEEKQTREVESLYQTLKRNPKTREDRLQNLLKRRL